MMLLLKLILLTTTWCLGVKILTARGMLLQKLGSYGNKQVEKGNIIFDALVVCEFCLPSIHSLVGYGFAIVLGVITGFSWTLVLIYPLVAIGSSISTGFIWGAYNTMNSAKDLYESKTEFYDRFYEIEDEEYFINEYQKQN